MAGRLSTREPEALGRVSSYKPTLQQRVDQFTVPNVGQSKPIIPISIAKNKEVISAAPVKKRAPLGRLIEAVLPKRFSDPILNTANKIDKFIAPPTFSDQMVRALDEQPGATPEQLRTRALELDKEDLIMANPNNPFKNRWVMDDMTGGTVKKTVGNKIKQAVLKKLAGTQDDKIITSLLSKHAPELSESQRNIVANIVKPLNDEKKIASILENASFAAQGKPVQPALDLGTKVPQGRVVVNTPKPVDVPVTKASDVTVNIADEARKYKTADEFVKSKGDVIYHTTDKEFDKFDNKFLGSNTGDIANNVDRGFFFAENIKDIEDFKKTLSQGKTDFRGNELTAKDVSKFRTIEKVADKSKFFQLNEGSIMNGDIPEKDAEILSKLFGTEDGTVLKGKDAVEHVIQVVDEQMGDLREFWDVAGDDFIKELQDNGYLGFKTNFGKGVNEFVVLDPNKLPNKSEIEDIWKKSNPSVEVSNKPRTPKELQETTQTMIKNGELPATAKTPFDTENIIKAREEANSIVKTSTVNTPERDVLRTDITSKMYGTGAVKKEKRLDIVMGPPAAGKSSTLVEPLLKKHQGMLADSDEFKKMLPEFDDGRGAMAVHDESAVLNAKMMFNMAFPAGDNIVYPTVGKNLETLERFIAKAKEFGYEVHVHLNDLEPEKAAGRAISRFNETNRFVDPDYVINQVGLSPRENFDIIKSNENVTEYAKYSNDVPKGESPRLLEEGTNSSGGSVRRSGDNNERNRDGGGTKENSNQSVNSSRPNVKLEARVKEAISFDDFYTKSGLTREALDATAQKKGYADAIDYYDRTKSALAEDDALQLAADIEQGSEFVLQKSAVEQEKISSNLRAIFADMKGLTLDDITLKFTEEDLDLAERNYDILMESLMNDPAQGLSKYLVPAVGVEKGMKNFKRTLPEVTGLDANDPLRKTMYTKNKQIKPYIEFKMRGDDIANEMGFDSSEVARAAFEAYQKRRNDAVEVFQALKDIRHNIRLAKQAEVFVGANQTKLAKELATNLQTLKKIVQAAERGGFRKGLSVGTQKYTAMVARLKTRRNRITAIKKAYNLTDAQMKDVRGTADPRFMTADEFDKYIADIQGKAELVQRKTTERMIIDAIISEKDIKKSENLQRALEFPPLKNMSLEELIQFSDILSNTRYGDTFLGPRMIQTAINTDLGAIRTIQDGVDAVVRQTGMPVTAGSVDGSKVDGWLRDATLVDKDPLHKLFITEWVGKEVDMLGRKAVLQQELNKLARESRASRKRGIWDRIAPQDPLPVEYSQTAPELLPQMEAKMTPAEIKFGKFLRGFFERYYELVQMDAANRFTLRGVKYSRFKDMYFPHMSRQFFERAREDGFVKAIRILWDSNVADSKIDFNAFGDRGEVLGYEKWFKNSMKREAENGAYTKNAPKTALAYFHAFEKKLLLDSMIPKAKLYEFLLGKRYQTPKSVNNQEGAEKIHSVLTKHINEWLNNKKGQRVKMVYEQGDSIEAVVDASSMLVSMIDLGGNIVTQTASAVGGEIMTLRGAGIKGWGVGHTRSLTGRGRQLGYKYAGVIGETPWNELASVANDVGDTLRGGLFYIFGDMAYRARRQMFLGLLTKEEFATGNITQNRIGEIKLQMGKWHTMPEFRSVNGSTSLLKAAGKYTEWATPMFQTAVSDVVKLRNEIRVAGNDPKKLAQVVRSKPFIDTLNTVLVGAGTYLLGQYIFQPESADKDTWAGAIRIKAAQEAGSILQGASGIGVFSNMRMSGFVSDLADALLTLANMETYATAGPGHDKGDLKAPDAFAKLLIPKFVKQFLPTPETPLRTKEDILSEIKQGVDDGTLTVSAAKEKYIAEMESLKEAQTKRKYELSNDEYLADLRTRFSNEEISVSEAKKEYEGYVKQKKTREPESFESDSDSTFIQKVKVYAEAVGTDPITAFALVFQGEAIRRTDNGAIIVHRMSFEDSTKKKKELGSKGDLVLDHTIPLQIGGTNGDSNLRLVPKEEWEKFTPVENFLGRALRTEDISEKKARQLITDFKAGKLTAEQVYAEVEKSSQ